MEIQSIRSAAPFNFFVDIDKVIEHSVKESKIGNFYRELFRHLLNPVFTNMVIVPSNKDIIAYYPSKQFIYMAYDLPHLSHEVAHMVEMQDMNRILLPDWGMLAFDDKGKISDKGFFAALARETRARAIGQVLEGKEFKHYDHPSWHNTNGLLKGRLPFGRFKTRQDVLDWCEDMGRKTYNAWSLERIHHEWLKRAELIRNWQETKDEPIRAMQDAA